MENQQKSFVAKSFVPVGMMGSGKSSVGRALSEACGLPFMDSDALIEKHAQMSVGDIFRQLGEPHFRQLESQIICEILQGSACVLSVGGGAFMQDAVRAACKQYAVTVFLRLPADILWERVKNSPRPLVQSGYDAFAELSAARQATYEAADIIIDANGKTPQEIATEILHNYQ